MKIVGLFLIKNEDVFIEQAVLNVIEFCDEIYIEDNNSTDNTFQIVSSLAQRFSKVHVSKINDITNSHRHIDKYCGTNTWILGIDGDELYDKQKLQTFKKELATGKFDNQWVIFGNVLHCIELDLERKIAKGYLCPPAKSMTKLYNFSIINGWSEITERLHGYADYKEGYHAELRYPLYSEYTWDTAYFRCLHVAFVQRSTLDKANSNIRKNPTEVSWAKLNHLSFFARIRFFVINRWDYLTKNNYKYKDYMKGNIVEKRIDAFFK